MDLCGIAGRSGASIVAAVIFARVRNIFSSWLKCLLFIYRGRETLRIIIASLIHILSYDDSGFNDEDNKNPLMNEI